MQHGLPLTNIRSSFTFGSCLNWAAPIREITAYSLMTCSMPPMNCMPIKAHLITNADL
jgi:hypothetical protein